MSSDIGLIYVLYIWCICQSTVYSISMFKALSHQTTKQTININEINDLLIGEIKTQPPLHMRDLDSNYDSASYNDENVSWSMSQIFTTNVLGLSSANRCADMEIKSKTNDYIPEICFTLSNAFWYGGAELQYQRWPLQNTKLPMQSFVTNDIVPLNQSFGNVIERRWINSLGLSIRVEDGVPLSVSFNSTDNDLCLKASNIFSISDQTLPSSLQYEICKFDNVLEAFNHVLYKPEGAPDTRMFKSPIWSTWAKYKIHIDQNKVLEYADEIVENGFSNSQIEIDDMFSTNYGDFDFTPEKFPTPIDMVKQLKSKGFRVTVWITPFANLDSKAFEEGLKHGYWLKDINAEVPALVKWWQGIGAILDVENQEAVDWFVERLEQMKDEFGIDSFKFDAGEVTYLPLVHEYSNTWTDPSYYTTKYVDAMSRMGSMAEVRCGYMTQRHPLFVRMGDKESRWGYDNGLQSIIPTVLTMGIMGYPYILPDMIGGNGYVYKEDVDNPFISTELPDRELYIRWLELTAYLPAMQFSFVPWQYDEEVVRIAKKFVDIHETIVTPLVLEAAEQSQTTGLPIIRPLWMIAPLDTYALECENEFLIGDTLLLAPVVEQGASHRSIYLPKGTWEDQLRGDSILGPKMLYSYAVQIDEVPTFKRIASSV